MSLRLAIEQCLLPFATQFVFERLGLMLQLSEISYRLKLCSKRELMVRLEDTSGDTGQKPIRKLEM